MGGRKSYSIDYVLGKSKKSKEMIVSSYKSKDAKKIVTTTIESFIQSDKAIEDLAKVTEFFDFIEKNAYKKELYYQERKKLSSKFWVERKKEKKISHSPEIDRILVDSVTKVIRRGKKLEK